MMFTKSQIIENVSNIFHFEPQHVAPLAPNQQIALDIHTCVIQKFQQKLPVPSNDLFLFIANSSLSKSQIF